MDDLYIVVTGTLAGFGAVGFGLKIQATAVDKLSGAIERLRDKLDNLNAPSRDEHNQLASEVKSIQVTVAQVRVELENIRHERRENDGG
jgi:outer membrane murein-binding lipoprotein Lpp